MKLDQSALNTMQAANVKGKFIWSMEEGKEFLKDFPKEGIQKAIDLTEYPSNTLNEEIIDTYLNTLRMLNFVKYKQISFAFTLFWDAKPAVKLNVLHKIEAAIDELSP
jgi:hypothetical protein